MFPTIKILSEKKLIGQRILLNFLDNKTFELWRRFMPRRKEIQNQIGTELYSIEVYKPHYFDNFNPSANFEKWAAIEVTDFLTIPNDMETITLQEGIYAVFIHRGPVSDGPKTYEYIFRTWLPNSNYILENRPHFALMGEKYKQNDPDSEEEIWIPIKLKE